VDVSPTIMGSGARIEESIARRVVKTNQRPSG